VARAGSNIAARMAMIAITTNNSIKVNACGGTDGRRVSCFGSCLANTLTSLQDVIFMGKFLGSL
jgi:hypothetical protein